MSDPKTKTGLPGVGDSLELMRKMWGLTGLSGVPTPVELAQLAVRLPQNLPNMVTPTLNLQEIDKRIADLRAVEQWLELNASLLRTSIQSLEVQRATIATIKGLTGSMMPGGFKGKPEEAAAMAAFQEQLAAFQALQAAVAGNVLAPAPAAGTPETEPGSPGLPFNPAQWWHAVQDQLSRMAHAATVTQNEAPAGKPRASARKRSTQSAPRATARKRSH